MHLELEHLAFDRGGSLLVKRALRLVSPGEALTVAGKTPDLYVHLRAWCRAAGHEFRSPDAAAGNGALIMRGPAAAQRWSGAERAGHANPLAAGGIAKHPPQRW